MGRFVCAAFFFTLIAVSQLRAQHSEKPVLALSCTVDKLTVAQGGSVNLTVSLENRGSSDVFIYRTLEWGWAGIGFTLTDERGHDVHPRGTLFPLPPPPVYDKSQLVGLAPGYFFGTHLRFDLSHYDLSPGIFYVQVSYQSNYPSVEGFGLPLLTMADGQIQSNKLRIEVHSK